MQPWGRGSALPSDAPWALFGQFLMNPPKLTAAAQRPACVTFPTTTSKGCFLLTTAPLCLPPHPSVSRQQCQLLTLQSPKILHTLIGGTNEPRMVPAHWGSITSCTGGTQPAPSTHTKIT